MVMFSDEEIEQAEELQRLLEVRGRVAVLSMVQNRIVFLMHQREISQSQTTILKELLEWIHPILSDELAHLGQWTEMQYSSILPLQLQTPDLDTILDGPLKQD